MRYGKNRAAKAAKQEVLFDEPVPNRWQVVTVEIKRKGVVVREEHRLRYGKTIHERGGSPMDLERFHRLAEAHNGLNLPPRKKVECLADAGGSTDANLKAQTKSAQRLDLGS